MGLEAFAKEFDSMLVKAGEARGEVAAASLASSGSQAEKAKAELSRIAQLILLCDCSVNPDQEEESYEGQLGNSRAKLAASLGCSTDDLQAIVDSYGEKWPELVLEERVRRGIDSTTMRDVSWDRLESAVLRKLLHLVDGNRVSTVSELLAIAKVANGAARGSRDKNQQSPGGGFMAQQNNFYGYVPGDPENGVLPSGNLGRISLTLSHRVKDQIAKTIDHEQDHVRTLDSVEMLELDEIQEAVESDEDKG